MSKKKKAAPGKAGKKKPVNKVARKVVKVTKKVARTVTKIATKKPLKKVSTVKVIAKSKPVKKIVGKVAKKVIVKAQKKTAKNNKPAKKLGVVAKNIFKKVVKAVKTKLHTVPKTAAKKAAVPAKKAHPQPAAKTMKQEKPVLKPNVSLKVEKQVKKPEAPKEKLNGSSKVGHSSNGKPHLEEKARKVAEVTIPRPAQKKPDVLAITNTIPVKQKNEISASKIASISYSITNPVRKTDSYAVRPEKEPHGKFEMEFVVHASAEMLYEFLSTPSGLSEWFCDDLNIRNGIYTFIWDDQLQQARLLKTVDQQLVRFQWVDKTDGSYFEFRIQRDDLTNDISLIITDFAESASDRESSKLLWNSQVEKLMHVIGSIF
jgi:uncharacterized protein YndB with AHSA1/START domain